ncbi:hypothetical protein TrVE_jg5042 [Triparma verrucosa]|uniref:Bicarbonate transporter-like transmembrane domain-containing protein n=2 Tax=Triparma TaxID=722752 RepID=A0A9W7C1L4_9STRA|nr:hypothetical protein TrVE_jg5042 [Triparma verrucosa]GMH96623.1 hypothetical protein TrST_g9377 [Triparma strigata]
MSFLAPTGLTLAFISSLYRFTTLYSIPFLPTYTCIGLWTSFYMFLVSITGAAGLIRFCTRFTDDVFNALLSCNFIYEACNSLRREFLKGSDKTRAFVCAGLAGSTFWMTDKVSGMERSVLFNEKTRRMIKDFGPAIIIITLSILNHSFLSTFTVPTLNVPTHLSLSTPRSLFVPISTLPNKIKLLSSIPALLLTCLFYFDQNISVRVVHSPENGLKKPAAYSMDMMALSFVTFWLSLTGLPWMCGATVQSMAHTKSLTTSHFDKETGEEVVESVVENRVTGFLVHAMIGGSLGFLGVLRRVPVPIVSGGVFLYLGKKLAKGNSFVARLTDVWSERSKLQRSHPLNKIGRKKLAIYTAVQLGCLSILWGLKSNSKTSIFFPGVIGLLMFLRSRILPRWFSEYEFEVLGDPSPKTVSTLKRELFSALGMKEKRKDGE